MIRRFSLISAAALAAVSLVSVVAEEDAIENFMKKFHKAPQGTDPICKKAVNGAASAEELAGLLAGYEAMAAVPPPAGDVASWKEKTGAVIVAVKGVQAHKENAGAALKEAINCKGCHSVHRP
jgi:hypothetical protein